jgi:glucokinase
VTERIPILEVGGTHVTAAWVDPAQWQVTDAHRADLDARGSAAELVSAFLAPAATLGVPAGAHWGVAMPGPFDYERGIARFTGVAKFDSLNGIDLRIALTEAMPKRPGSISFINDASAYLVGEWLAGAARGTNSSAILTLGTGIGSAFLRHGKVVDRGREVPPNGEVHLLKHAGRPLEDWVSRRAIRRSFADLAGGPDERDVREIADLARGGNPIAAKVIEDAFVLLGQVVAPWLQRFGAELLVVGGSMSKSWDLIEAPLTIGLGGSVPQVRPAQDTHNAPLVGAAYPAFTRVG